MLFHIVTIATLEDLPHFSGFLEPQNGLVRKNDFREDPLSTMYKCLFLKTNYFINSLFGIPNKYQNLLPLVEDPPLAWTGEDKGRRRAIAAMATARGGDRLNVFLTS